MRIFIHAVLSMTLAAAAFGQDAPKKKAAASDEQPAAEHTLSTPFGVVKTTKPPVAEAKPKKAREVRQVEKDGDDFKFSKKTPFGRVAWTRSEAELSADERDLAERNGLLKPQEEPVDDEKAETAAKKQP